MINYTFSADGFEKTDKIQKYVESKVKDLEKYIPRVSRESAELQVRMKKGKSKAEMYDCHLELGLKGTKLVASEKVEHSYAALDVTMAELKRQLADYKGKHSKQSLRRRAANFLRRRHADTSSEEE
jgi:ribosomal subunit interface protein